MPITGASKRIITFKSTGASEMRLCDLGNISFKQSNLIKKATST